MLTAGATSCAVGFLRVISGSLVASVGSFVVLPGSLVGFSGSSAAESGEIVRLVRHHERLWRIDRLIRRGMAHQTTRFSGYGAYSGTTREPMSRYMTHDLAIRV